MFYVRAFLPCPYYHAITLKRHGVIQNKSSASVMFITHKTVLFRHCWKLMYRPKLFHVFTALCISCFISLHFMSYFSLYFMSYTSLYMSYTSSSLLNLKSHTSHISFSSLSVVCCALRSWRRQEVCERRRIQGQTDPGAKTEGRHWPPP